MSISDPRPCCGKNWDECRCPVLPPEDKDELLEWYRSTLEYIASEENCGACSAARKKWMASICAKHRPAWLVAKGTLNGWTYRGGMPIEEDEEDDDDY